MLASAQPDSLGPSIRRVRHISRVLFRNLKDEKITGPIDCYYTLSLVDETQPFYTSSIALMTLNPSWVALPDGLFKDSRLAVRKDFRFRLFKKGSKAGAEGREDDVVFEADIEMRTLERIHASTSRQARMLPRLPENTVLFYLPDGIYTTERVHAWIKKNKPKEKNVTPSLFADNQHDASKESHCASAITVDEILMNVGRAQEIEAKLRAVQEDTAATQASIECLVQAEAAKLQKLHTNHVRAKRVAELKAMLTDESARLTKDRKRVADIRASLAPRAKLLTEHSRMLLKQKLEVEELRKRIAHAKKVTLEAVNVKVDARRRKLLHNLAFVYPLCTAKTTKPSPGQPPSDRTLMIRQLPIPLNNLTGCEDEHISTALGYVAHMVCMLSKYLEVPLRYRIIYLSSRSAVSDDVHSFSQCPLFFRNGSEDKRFKFGCFMLNKNLEHLLNMCYPDWQKQAARQTSHLENLRLLLYSQVPALQNDG